MADLWTVMLVFGLGFKAKMWHWPWPCDCNSSASASALALIAKATSLTNTSSFPAKCNEFLVTVISVSLRTGIVASGKRRYRPQTTSATACTISATYNVDIGHELTKISKKEWKWNAGMHVYRLQIYLLELRLLTSRLKMTIKIHPKWFVIFKIDKKCHLDVHI